MEKRVVVVIEIADLHDEHILHKMLEVENDVAVIIAIMQDGHKENRFDNDELVLNSLVVMHDSLKGNI